MTVSLARQTSSGAAWSLGARLVAQGVQFCATALLARLLAPEVYGLVGMIGALLGFAGLFVEIGIGTALVQRRDIDDEQLDSAFGLTVLLGLGMTVVVASIAPAIAAFYARPVLTALTRATALSFVLSAVAIVPRAVLVRRMEIRSVALIDLLGGITVAGTSIALAWIGAGIWALVVSSLTGTLASSVFFLAASRWRPRLARSFTPVRPLMKVSLNLLAFSAINYWARSIDNVLIGRVLGERELGLYMRAYALMLLPITQINAAIGTALVAGLSRSQEAPEHARSLYLRTLGLIAFISFPAMLGLSAVAPYFVQVVYGEKWIATAPILRILAAVGALQAVVNPTGWIYMSHGRTDLMFRWGVFSSAVLITSLATGVWLGSGLSVSITYLVGNLLILLPCLFYGGRVIDLPLRDFWRTLSPIALASTAMMAGVLGVDRLLPSKVGAPARLAFEVAVGMVLFAILTRILRLRPARDAVVFLSRSENPLAIWMRPAALLLVHREERRDLDPQSARS